MFKKSKNLPKGARSGFYQKGFCLFQFGMENCCAEVFEELGLKLDAVLSSSHLLFFFLWTFWSLWMYNLWCFPLSCDNECQWASWSRSLSFEKNLTEELTSTSVILHPVFRIHKLKHLQHWHRFSWEWNTILVNLLISLWVLKLSYHMSYFFLAIKFCWHWLQFLPIRDKQGSYAAAEVIMPCIA